MTVGYTVCKRTESEEQIPSNREKEGKRSVRDSQSRIKIKIRTQPSPPVSDTT